MLSYLSIKNYILIRELEMEFRPGFTAITGETGAGKSILVGALSLILGRRADTDVLLDKGEKCIIEGVFRLSGPELLPFFEENEIDFEEQLVLRREISSAGKSRAFINDTPVLLPLMRELGERLVDIHSQHETLMLGESGFQLALVDSYAGNSAHLEQMKAAHSEYARISSSLDNLLRREKSLSAEAEFMRYQFEELERASLTEGETEQLEEEQKLLTHAEEIKSNLFEASQVLYSADENLVGKLKHIAGLLGKISGYHTESAELHNRLESARIELQDIGQTLSRLEDGINYDPERLEEVNSRLDLIYALLKKHRQGDIAGLAGIREELKEKLSLVENIDGDIQRLRDEASKAREDMLRKAKALHERRQMVIPAMEEQLTATLALLGMEKGRLSIQMNEQPECTEMGTDQADFYFSANPGIVPAPLAKIASGGELSRLMLALKSLISSRNLLPTIILDEIDMGVSGEIAGKVGKVLSGMSRNMQLIVITHLPQIAGMAQNHCKVYKETASDRTVSGVKRLSDVERVEEIAGMLSNETVTDAARATAKELLNKN